MSYVTYLLQNYEANMEANRGSHPLGTFIEITLECKHSIFRLNIIMVSFNMIMITHMAYNDGLINDHFSKIYDI